MFQYIFFNDGLAFGFFLLIGLKEDESKHVLHLSLNRQLDVVRWNLSNQDEVGNQLLVLVIHFDNRC